MRGWLLRVAAGFAASLAIVAAAGAADYPAPRKGDFTLQDFRFHTGEVIHALHLHYLTIGDPRGEPVLVLHGTAGSAAGLLTASYAGELFGPGQPLDARKYFIIIPDGIGAGQSAKPSDGLRAHFPAYDYDDMVEAQYRLVTEGLGVGHLRLVTGVSMGGMHAWLWGERHPDFMDALAPVASQPAPMSSRNWMLRRLLIDSIRQDPAWNGGDYVAQPPAFRTAAVFFSVATDGGSIAYQKAAPTSEAADRLVEARLAGPFDADANDYIYQWSASRDYDPSPDLERITAKVLAINSADDERNPPETGVVQKGLARVRDARLYLIPASEETHGHSTFALARLYADQLRDLLASAPHRTQTVATANDR